MADYSYKKADPALSLANIEAATGLVLSGVVVTPEIVAVLSSATSLSPADEAQLDVFMADIGFAKLFP
jgi:hypothetical protein